HLLHFGTTRRHRKLVREGLARRVPVAPTPRAGGRSLAFVAPGGAGKTASNANPAIANASGSDLPAICVTRNPPGSGAELRSRVAGAAVKGPAIGQTVQVVAPSGASLDARVKGTGGGSFLLRFYTAPRELLAGRTVSLEFTNRRGVCRIPGSAESAAGESVLQV